MRTRIFQTVAVLFGLVAALLFVQGAIGLVRTISGDVGDLDRTGAALIDATLFALAALSAGLAWLLWRSGRTSRSTTSSPPD